MKPLNDFVAIRQVEHEETTKSGLFIPGQTRARNNEGVVVCVGAGRWESGIRVPVELAAGDRVLYNRFGYTVTLNNTKIYMVQEPNVLMVLDDDERATFTGETIAEAETNEGLADGE